LTSIARKSQSGLDRFGEWSRREPSDMDVEAREGSGGRVGRRTSSISEYFWAKSGL